MRSCCFMPKKNKHFSNRITMTRSFKMHKSNLYYLGVYNWICMFQIDFGISFDTPSQASRCFHSVICIPKGKWMNDKRTKDANLLRLLGRWLHPDYSSHWRYDSIWSGSEMVCLFFAGPLEIVFCWMWLKNRSPSVFIYSQNKIWLCRFCCRMPGPFPLRACTRPSVPHKPYKWIDFLLFYSEERN